MSKEKVDKLIKEINDLKVSELVQVFNGVLGINDSNCQNEKDKDNYEDQKNIFFDVILLAAGAGKIRVIKAIRELTGLGIKEAKELVESAPIAVKINVSKSEANDIAAKLKDVGAEVEIR